MMDSDEFQRGITIPVVQSGCLFVVAGGLALGLALWEGWRQAWEVALAAGSLAAGLWVFTRFVVYWDLYIRAREPVYEATVETVTPVQEQGTVRLQLDSLDGKRTEFMELPVSEGQFRALARGVMLHGMVLSEESLTGKGKLFSKEAWNALRDELIRRGLLEWRSDRSRQSGLHLTAKGYEVLKAAAGSPTPGGNGARWSG